MNLFENVEKNIIMSLFEVCTDCVKFDYTVNQ